MFGYIVPNFKELTSLEQQMCGVPAKRIYDSISATWPEASILTEAAAIGATDLRASRVDDQGLAFHIRA